MSRAATDWAWSVQIKPASLKLLLLSMADRADEDHRCYPSCMRLEKDTGLNRKTILAGISTLIEQKVIRDTGLRKGATKRVRVFQLSIGTLGAEAYKPNLGTIKKSDPSSCEDSANLNGTENGNNPKNGTLNGTKNGTLNSTENGIQNQSTEPVNEPLKDITHNCVDAESQNSNSLPVAKPKKAAKPKTELNYSSWPSMPSDQVMADWVALRKQKRSPISQTVVNQFGKQFVEAAKHGFSVEDCLTECVMRGWAGFKCEWLLKTQSNNTNWQAQKEAKDEQNRRDIEDWINSDETGYSYYSSNSDNNVIDGECSNEPF